MTRPLVSIIIPCFNAEQCIADAIESALGQAYDPIEVIVIDDGSTDESRDVIRSFDERIRWEFGPNRGGSAARNRGLELARGEMIQFLDADDLLDPCKIERQASLLESDQNSLVFCRARVIDLKTGTSLGVWGSSNISCEDAIIYVLRSVLQTAAPLHWKHNLMRIGGWREGLPAGQDPDLHMRLACEGIRFKNITDKLLTIRRMSGSVSDKNAFKGYACWIASAQNAYDDLNQKGQMNEERSAAFAGFFAKVARIYLRSGRRPEAKCCFEKAFSFHPFGGIPQAYSDGTRYLRRLIGSSMTERLVCLKRRFSRRVTGSE